MFLERILCCFINDAVGVKLIDLYNIDNVCWESDYPHSDSSWPHAPEILEPLLAELSDAQINKITHENAMRHYRFDPFSIRPKEQCTVAALRAEAARRRRRRRVSGGHPTRAISRPGRRSPTAARALNAQTR